MTAWIFWIMLGRLRSGITPTLFSFQVTDYHSISFWNVSYKLIVTWFIANRMKRVLNDIIDECQSTFIPGRSIVDNLILGHESLHYLSEFKRGKTRLAASKLDMAYNKVEWSYINQVMAHLGFNPKWIELVMNCISFATFFYYFSMGSKGSYCSF